jgi:tetratricopeptide (TPR) repeat protein
MDCRSALFFLPFLSALLAGCQPSQVLPFWPVDHNAEIAKAAEAAQTASAVEPISKEPVKEMMPATLVAMAAFRDQTANEVARTDGQKQALHEAAVAAYEKALKADPKFLPAQVGLARHWESLDQHERALACYGKALQLAPTCAALWHEVGMCQARHQEWQPALDRLHKATELESNDRRLGADYALCLVRAGHIDEGLNVLSRWQKEPEAHYTVAQMLYQMNQDDACRRHLGLALQADPNFKPAQELLATLNAPSVPNQLNN